MTWQEIVFSAGNVGFAVTLVPTLFDRRAYVPRLTSVPIAQLLACYVPAFASLGMPVAAVFTAFTVGCWTFIAWRRGTPPVAV